MNTTARLLSAVAAVAVVAVIGALALPRLGGNGGLSTSPSPPAATPSPATTSPAPPSAAAPSSSGSAVALGDGPISAGTHVVGPAPKDRFWSCPGSSTSSCTDTISVIFTVPDGWTGGTEMVTLNDNASPDGASLLFTRGAPLYTDPCGAPSTVPLGPKAADFANALANHPLLDVTAPVDVTLAGHSGKYVDLQVPADISACPIYRPWEPGLYAQGPSQRWHLWILDVGGQRVVVQSTDYVGTSAQRRAELQAIVNSIEFQF
jgi:hypothetical protein